MIRRLFLAVALVLAVPAAGTPRFIPNPKQTFDEFVALNAPRPEVPVGALWIDGYGPSGQAATPDNLETVRSLNGMVIDKNLQLSLTAGLLNFIQIEPRLRDHYSARFSDLSIVKVKDVTRLAGPPGEPRIVEAIKAGSILVSTDGEVGLNARSGWTLTNADGTTNNAKARAYSIDGRDLFIAIRVATLKVVRSEDAEVRLHAAGQEAVGRTDDFEIHIKSDACPASPLSADCRTGLAAAVIKLSTWPSAPAAHYVVFDEGLKARVELPVPISDGSDGLYTSMSLEWLPVCTAAHIRGCAREPRVRFHYEGRRVDDLGHPDMGKW